MTTATARVDENLLLPFEGVFASEIDRRFAEYRKKHPEVERELVRAARRGLARGRKRLGMKNLYEYLRWSMPLDANGETFKLPNDFTSRYARLLMRKYPDLRGVFETRKLRS